jgi:hypothetical protein
MSESMNKAMTCPSMVARKNNSFLLPCGASQCGFQGRKNMSLGLRNKVGMKKDIFICLLDYFIHFLTIIPSTEEAEIERITV